MSKDAYFRPNEHKSPFDVGTNLFVFKNCTDKSAPTLFEQYHLNLIRDKTIRRGALQARPCSCPKIAQTSLCLHYSNSYQMEMVLDLAFDWGSFFRYLCKWNGMFLTFA